MSQSDRFPVDIIERFAKFIRDASKDIAGLKQLTAVLEMGSYVTPYTGVIDAGYVSGRPLVDLPTGVQIGPCPYNSSYTPHAGDSVLLVPSGQTYIVVGKIV